MTFILIEHILIDHSMPQTFGLLSSSGDEGLLLCAGVTLPLLKTSWNCKSRTVNKNCFNLRIITKAVWCYTEEIK